MSASSILSVALPASAQTTFSVDWHSSQMGIFDPCTGTPVTEGDILIPAGVTPLLGPLATPCIVITGGAGGLKLGTHAGCVGHPPFVPCRVELDALSYGTDTPVPTAPLPFQRWWFSVDEDAVGIPGFPLPPNVGTEGALAASSMEAATDLFTDTAPPGAWPPGPLPPFAAPFGTRGAIDGNGMVSSSGFTYPGLGLLEKTLPFALAPPHPGDNLDAVDMDGPLGIGAPVFFSLDSGFVDPKLGILNSGSAVANAFVGGDVITTIAGAGPPPVLYAPAPALGLDLLGGPDSDDLDALILAENGIPGFQPGFGPFSWFGAGGTDMLLFSVRRGSAVIGAPDSIFGLPIEPGDVLIPPVVGGVSPFPGIWIAAENFGLATTRGGFAPFGDDLNALDFVNRAVLDCDADGLEDSVALANGLATDCNGNGIPDRCDIASGRSCDSNGNLVPDECDFGLAVPYCVGKVSSFGIGCVPFIDSIGTPSATCPSPFLVTGGNIRSFSAGLLFYGYGSTAIPFLGGTLCVAPPLRRLPIMSSGGSLAPFNCTGSYTFDFNALIQSGVDPFLVPGALVFAQWWFRDPPNTFGVGLSNALSIPVGP